MAERFAIVVAGGKGLRMGSDIPKQFIPVGGTPVLMRTLSRLHAWDDAMTLVLVLPATQRDYWQTLCRDHRFTVPHAIVDGGDTRFHSVLNGLRHVQSLTAAADALVAVHDGVRPFVSFEVLDRCFATAALQGAAIPVVPVVETLRELTGTPSPANGNDAPDGAAAPGSITRDRSLYRLVQTPQVFRLDLLSEAYRQPYRETFTDDASVVEALGHVIALTDGNRENIKLTTPYDLTIAATLCTI